ncbi:enolase C-terminal domain-like protein [Streptomyces sp. NPDC029044]|uniref:enolase C-terminal domain-like protein n=1 Tax=Streptomyces sp. NPDC029044 TaxID=3157198 RepID=UPI003407D7E7
MTQEAPHDRTLHDGPVVERLAVSVYRIPTDLPGGDATLTWDATTMVLVEATAAGVTGLGFTYGSPATATVVEHELADLVVGHDAFDVPAANDRMSRALRNAGRPGIAAGAVSAVDTALWDLKARLLDLPLVRLLGAVRDEVAVYGSGGLTPYDDTRLEQQLRGWTGLGIDRVKIKVAESWGRREARDLHRTALARRAVGDAAELYVDANGGYTRKQAVRMAAAMADLGVTWLATLIDALHAHGSAGAGEGGRIAAGSQGVRSIPGAVSQSGADGALDPENVRRRTGLTDAFAVAH